MLSLCFFLLIVVFIVGNISLYFFSRAEASNPLEKDSGNLPYLFLFAIFSGLIFNMLGIRYELKSFLSSEIYLYAFLFLSFLVYYALSQNVFGEYRLQAVVFNLALLPVWTLFFNFPLKDSFLLFSCSSFMIFLYTAIYFYILPQKKEKEQQK